LEKTVMLRRKTFTMAVLTLGSALRVSPLPAQDHPEQVILTVVVTYATSDPRGTISFQFYDDRQGLFPYIEVFNYINNINNKPGWVACKKPIFLNRWPGATEEEKIHAAIRAIMDELPAPLAQDAHAAPMPSLVESRKTARNGDGPRSAPARDEPGPKPPLKLAGTTWSGTIGRESTTVLFYHFHENGSLTCTQTASAAQPVDNGMTMSWLQINERVIISLINSNNIMQRQREFGRVSDGRIEGQGTTGQGTEYTWTLRLCGGAPGDLAGQVAPDGADIRPVKPRLR
jgi:hypothetical protein